ncbi:MAG: hypothetical protein ACM31O_14430 [Bacteroidota bacterium]
MSGIGESNRRRMIASREGKRIGTSLQPAMQRLVAVLVASVFGMAAAARLELTATTVACAALFVIIAIATAVQTNTATGEAPAPGVGTIILRRNTHLIAMSYAWAALAMLTLYLTPLTGLRWQHGWQYGLAFALLAGGTFLYALILGDERRPDLARQLAQLATPLAAVQALIAAGGLVYLVASGKMLAGKGDWAANVVFAFAALAIMAVCALALRTDARLMRSPPSDA